jgi:hypothetical protein
MVENVRGMGLEDGLHPVQMVHCHQHQLGRLFAQQKLVFDSHCHQVEQFVHAALIYLHNN